jgi:hypothetical protein
MQQEGNERVSSQHLLSVVLYPLAAGEWSSWHVARSGDFHVAASSTNGGGCERHSPCQGQSRRTGVGCQVAEDRDTNQSANQPISQSANQPISQSDTFHFSSHHSHLITPISSLPSHHSHLITPISSLPSHHSHPHHSHLITHHPSLFSHPPIVLDCSTRVLAVVTVGG